MRLHHFTGPENLFLISLRGLEPDIKEYNAWQTLGQQVVWLTRQETNRATAAEVEHWRQFWKEDNECAYPRKPGAPMFGANADTHETVRLTVNIEKHNKKLVKYTEWLRRAVAYDCETRELVGKGADILKMCRSSFAPGNLDQWWIYFGTIKPSRIEFVPGWPPGLISAGVALPGVEYQSKTHDSLEARASFAAQALALRAAAPDTPCNFQVMA